MFELKIGEEKIILKWGTYAMKIFGILDGMPDVDHFFAVISEFGPDEKNVPRVVEKSRMFTILEKMLIAGHENATGVRVDERTVCGWIDACGGILKVNEGQMVEYINYIVANTLNGVTKLPNDQSLLEKKNE